MHKMILTHDFETVEFEAKTFSELIELAKEWLESQENAG
jgi:hypothetical protein